jgi:hypothetical protein
VRLAAAGRNGNLLAADPSFIQPSAIAEEVWHVAQQERSAGSFNIEIRPFAEPW